MILPQLLRNTLAGRLLLRTLRLRKRVLRACGQIGLQFRRHSDADYMGAAVHFPDIVNLLVKIIFVDGAFAYKYATVGNWV